MIKYNVDFFQQKEFRCPCCNKGLASVQLVYFLDNLRRAWDAPIRVNSAYRCEKHNKEVGGAKNSRHLIGCAADITLVYATELLEPFKYLVKSLTKRRFDWEVIEYPWGMHVAVPRGEGSFLWDGGDIAVAMK